MQPLRAAVWRWSKSESSAWYLCCVACHRMHMFHAMFGLCHIEGIRIAVSRGSRAARRPRPCTVDPYGAPLYDDVDEPARLSAPPAQLKINKKRKCHVYAYV